jgi:hypothetical protein
MEVRWRKDFERNILLLSLDCIGSVSCGAHGVHLGKSIKRNVERSLLSVNLNRGAGALSPIVGSTRSPCSAVAARKATLRYSIDYYSTGATPRLAGILHLFQCH